MASLKGFVRVHYLLREPEPRVSCIVLCAAGGPPRLLESLLAGTDYGNYEVLLLAPGGGSPASGARGAPRGKVRTVTRGAAAELLKEARGELCCFLGGDLEVTRGDWLRNLAASVHSREIGAVGGKLVFGDGSLSHAGYVLSGGEGALEVLRGLPPGRIGPFGRAVLAQEVSAASLRLLMVRKELLLRTEHAFDGEAGARRVRLFRPILFQKQRLARLRSQFATSNRHHTELPVYSTDPSILFALSVPCRLEFANCDLRALTCWSDN